MKLTAARFSQLLFLGIFLVLFVLTEYRGKDEIPLAVNSFFRADALVVVSYLLAEKSFSPLLLPGLILIVSTVFLGRFFCGWLCPLGTIIDLVTERIRKTAPLGVLKSYLKYYLLVCLLVVSLFNLNLAGLLDPIAILIRAMTFFLYPVLGESVRGAWVGLYGLIGEQRDHLSFLYSFLKDYLLPFRETFYPLAFISLLLFSGILFLERYEKRNWCRNLCPLGTLLGLMARFSFFRRLPGKLCPDCGDCRQHCPTTFDTDILQKQDCIICLDCGVKCRFDRVRFSLRNPFVSDQRFMPDRRVLLTGALSGFVVSRVFSFTDVHARERLLRPPGVRSEEEFLRKCVRCGECMKVCLRNALYPAVLQSGLYGIFSPVLIPRSGYCEYNCTLCGQVCPTGAIPHLPVQDKKKALIGIAVVDRNHCLPFAKRTNCIVCEEHCPIPNKAIRFEVVQEKNYEGRTVTLKKPYVVDNLCNGCGICEYVCPVDGKAAIEVFPRKTPSGSTQDLPAQEPYGM